MTVLKSSAQHTRNLTALQCFGSVPERGSTGAIESAHARCVNLACLRRDTLNLSERSTKILAPGARVHPEVVTVMGEVGVDLSQHAPTFLSDQLATTASLLITMGCGEA